MKYIQHLVRRLFVHLKRFASAVTNDVRRPFDYAVVQGFERSGSTESVYIALEDFINRRQRTCVIDRSTIIDCDATRFATQHARGTGLLRFGNHRTADRRATGGFTSIRSRSPTQRLE